jgi:hypothetical protein
VSPVARSRARARDRAFPRTLERRTDADAPMRLVRFVGSPLTPPRISLLSLTAPLRQAPPGPACDRLHHRRNRRMAAHLSRQDDHSCAESSPSHAAISTSRSHFPPPTS